MTPIKEQKEGPCDFSFACADYHSRRQETYDAAKKEIKARTYMLWLAIVCAIVIVALTGCKTVIPSVLTESRAGEALTQVVIPAQGDRDEVPVGVNKDDVVAQVHTDSGSTIVIAENKDRTIVDRVMGKKKYTAYLDNKAVAEAKEVQKQGKEMVAQPKAPWWKWPVYALIGIAALAFIYFLRPIIALLKSLVDFMGRLKK